MRRRGGDNKNRNDDQPQAVARHRSPALPFLEPLAAGFVAIATRECRAEVTGRGGATIHQGCNRIATPVGAGASHPIPHGQPTLLCNEATVPTIPENSGAP